MPASISASPFPPACTEALRLNLSCPEQHLQKQLLWVSGLTLVRTLLVPSRSVQTVGLISLLDNKAQFLQSVPSAFSASFFLSSSLLSPSLSLHLSLLPHLYLPSFSVQLSLSLSLPLSIPIPLFPPCFPSPKSTPPSHWSPPLLAL